MQSRDCLQTKNEEEEESWPEGDQMAEQWEEEQHLEEIVEKKKDGRNLLKLDVMHKVLELTVKG